jgi:hypothetical protein
MTSGPQLSRVLFPLTPEEGNTVYINTPHRTDSDNNSIGINSFKVLCISITRSWNLSVT